MKRNFEMSDLSHDTPVNSAKLLLPVVIIGMLLLVCVMYFGGMSNGFFAQ